MIDFEYTVLRSNRKKTVGLVVSPEGVVTITAPRHATDEQIRGIVEKKSRWIQARLALYRDSSRAPVEYGTGTELPLLGRRYVLQIVEGLTHSVRLEGDEIRIHIPLRLEGAEKSERIAAQLTHWYGMRALEVIRERVLHYQERLGVRARAVRIKTLRSRWGSCSSRGNLSFGWQLVMAPPEIVDYVVVHELCHLRRMDHSPQFWTLVESVIPGYRECREWLRRNGARLTL